MTRTSPRIQFGATTFDGASIKGASVLEEVDPISRKLPIGTLEFTLYSTDPNLAITNPLGLYALFQRGQPVVVYEEVNGADVLIGQYFIDRWENTSGVLLKLSCVDALGLLDKLPYDGGMWLTPTTLGERLQDVLGSVNIAYDLDPDLYSFPISGWSPISNRREALQQLAFAAGATITCARQSGVIKIGRTQLAGSIFKGVYCGVVSAGQSYVRGRRWRTSPWINLTDTGYTDSGILCGVVLCGQSRMRAKRWRQGTWHLIVSDITITRAEKGAEAPLALKPLVTGVEVTAHDFVAGTESMELYNGALAVGLHKIEFSQPCHTLTPTGATISSSGANYAWLDVAAAGTVVLSGLKYTDTTKTFGVYDPDNDVNTLKVPLAYLVNSFNAAETAQRCYNYFQQRYLQKTKLFAPPAATGNLVLIDTLYGLQIRGVVEKMDIDLAKGFVAQTNIVGAVG